VISLGPACRAALPTRLHVQQAREESGHPNDACGLVEDREASRAKAGAQYRGEPARAEPAADVRRGVRRARDGVPCPSSRELVLPKIVDFDPSAGRFTYDDRTDSSSRTGHMRPEPGVYRRPLAPPREVPSEGSCLRTASDAAGSASRVRDCDHAALTCGFAAGDVDEPAPHWMPGQASVRHTVRFARLKAKCLDCKRSGSRTGA
jgi:hypothetical protein